MKNAGLRVSPRTTPITTIPTTPASCFASRVTTRGYPRPRRRERAVRGGLTRMNHLQDLHRLDPYALCPGPSPRSAGPRGEAAGGIDRNGPGVGGCPLLDGDASAVRWLSVRTQKGRFSMPARSHLIRHRVVGYESFPRIGSAAWPRPRSSYRTRTPQRRSSARARVCAGCHGRLCSRLLRSPGSGRRARRDVRRMLGDGAAYPHIIEWPRRVLTGLRRLLNLDSRGPSELLARSTPAGQRVYGQPVLMIP
jgi:hypothetical protein